MSSRTAWLNGRLVPFSDAGVPLNDRGLLFSESLYEVVPICGGQARLLGEHAARMRAGAAALGLAEGVPGDVDWRSLAEALIADEGTDEGLLYAQLTGGSAPRRHLPKPRPDPTFFAYIEAYRFPRQAQVERGIAAVHLPDLRWARCDLKTTMLLAAVLAKAEAAARGAQEAVLVGHDGLVREGASSNLFALKGRTLTTPLQGPRLLPGTIRPLVSALAAELGLQTDARELPLGELYTADELFVTSTTFLLMPVLCLDDRQIGGGRSGPVARELARLLRIRLGLGD